MQYYLLDKVETASANEESLAQLLEDSRRTPDAIFGDLLEAAVKHSSEPDKSQQQLAGLICLTRPVPIHVFANAVGISLREASNFCRALVPGVVLENDEVSFRDENFETYLRDRLTPDELTSAQGRLGTHFLTRATQDSYAAKVVAEHLFLANQYQEVINLAIAGLDSSVIQDHILRLQIQRRRITLAMKSACKLGYEDEAVRLTLLAAETARSDSAATALVRENPELAARYGDTDSVARLYSRNENDSWLGSVHLRTAAMYACDPAQRDRAEEHLRAAEAWIRRWSALPRHERSRWNLSISDIAYGAEAVFWLEGAEQAKLWLSHWRPIRFVIDAASYLAQSLAKHLSPEQQDQLLDELEIPLRVSILFLTAFAKSRARFSSGLIKRINQTVERLDQLVQKGRKISKIKDYALLFICEIIALNEVDRERILRLTQALCPQFPQTSPYDYIDFLKYDLPLRAVCLQAVLTGKNLTTDELLPERYRPKEGQRDNYDSERRRFHEIIGKVLSGYQIRARTIIEKLTVTDIAETLSKELRKRLQESGYRWFKGDWQYALWAEKAYEALLNCSGVAESLLEEIADSAEPIMRGAAPRLWIDLAEGMMLQGLYRPLAYRLLEQAAQYVIDKPFPGRDRWQTLLRCASVVSRYDEELGRDYYKRSLAAAESIDDDSVYLLSWLSRLAHQIAPSLSVEDRRNFSIRLAHIVEAYKDYASEPLDLPWKVTLGAVSRLDAAHGLALCSRWDDENHFQLEDGIIPVVKEVTESSFFSPLEGFWLLRLAGERYDVSKDAIPLLERLRTTGVSARSQLVQMMQALSCWVRRDIPLAERTAAATRIVEWADAHGMGQLAGIADLRELISFVSSLPPREDRDSPSPYRPTATRESTVQSIIDDARSGSFADLETQLLQVWMDAGSSSTIQEFLTILGRSVAPSRRVHYLNELISLDVSPSLVHEIATALRTYLTQWRNSTIIQAWVPGGIGKFLELHLPALLVSWYGSVTPLEEVLSLPNLTGQTRAALLLPAINQHLESLSPQELYTAAKLLAVPLPPEKIRDIFNWSLTRAEMQIEQSREMRPVLQAQLPDTSPAVLAHFFWALFGHPDKQVRWRALHAARAIIKLPNQALLEELVKLSWSETAGAFRSSQLDFYWMSARTWLMLLFQRLADECPQVLQKHVQAIADHALNRTFPHAQIRELAKQAALRIVKHEPRSLPPNIVEQLNFTNAPSACLYLEEERFNHINRRQQTADSRFDFTMNTLPYWYAPASSVFGHPYPGITEQAEKWICDQWGRTNEDWYKDPRELRSENRWQKMSNRQGTVPEYENLHTYLEYNAMFCAAGEMIDSLPVTKSSFEDFDCSWRYWLDRHLSLSGIYWASELRSQTPHRPDCFGELSSFKASLKKHDSQTLNSALGLREKTRNGYLVVHGHISLHAPQNHGYVHVKSALVTPETARSLLHALQTTNWHNFQLPVIWNSCELRMQPDGEVKFWLSEGQSAYEFEILEQDFELKAWLKEIKVNSESLDQFDPLIKEMEFSFETFREDLIGTMHLSPMSTNKGFFSPNGTLVAELEIWSDSLKEEYIAHPFSIGQRWWICIETLLEYLKHKNRDLLVEIKIEHKSKSDRHREERDDFEESTICLLRRDGTLETLDSCRDIRQTDRERTRSGG